MLIKIINILSIPILFLNAFGVLIGSIWLAFLGQWKFIGEGIFGLIIFYFIISILLLLKMPFARITIRLFEKKSPFGYILAFISQLYINILIVATCALAFTIWSNIYEEVEGIGKARICIGFVPYLLWSWGMALGPWQFLASKEPYNEFSAITQFSASVFYFLFLVSLFISLTLSFIIAIIFGVVHLIVLPTFNIYIAGLGQEG